MWVRPASQPFDETATGGLSAVRLRRDRCRRRRRRGHLRLCLCRAGKSVLVLERGDRYTTTSPSHDEKATLIDKGPYDDREVDVNGTAKRLYMGGVLGGGTSLYGGALVRPSEQDFQPGKYYGKRIPRAIWDWPISYADLEPYYTEAERLYGVAGRGDEDFGPLQKPAVGYPGEPLPLHPLNQRLIAANRVHGLHPFRLPLAIDSSRCLRCGVCAGYICPTVRAAPRLSCSSERSLKASL